MFGPLKAFHLAKHTPAEMAQQAAKGIIPAGQEPSANKGFCFAEFVDPANTAIAIQGLDGLAIGEKKLTCRYAGDNNKPKVQQQLPSSSTPLVVDPMAAAAALFAVNGVSSHPRKIEMLMQRVSERVNE